MPRKKIYDVKPPKAKKAEKLEKDLKEFFDEKPAAKRRGRTVAARTSTRKMPEAAVHHARHEQKPKSKRTWYAAGGVVVLGLGIYLFFALPRVTVTIEPVVDIAQYQQTLSADVSMTTVDTSKLVIPAKYFESSKSASEAFQATGNADDSGKASGTITIYNKADPTTPLTLKAGTRFISDSGYVFVTLQKVVVPAGKKSGSKVTPGSITVQVEAAEGGEPYNISASSFSIPGLKGTAYYYTVYGSSEKAMAGGFSSSQKKITDTDIQSAKDSLSEKLVQQATDDIKGQVGADYILLDNAVSPKISIADGQAKAGTVTQNFTMEGSVTAKAVAFSKSDLDEFIKSYVISQATSGKAVLDSSITEDYSLLEADIQKGIVRLSVSFSAGTYGAIDENKLALAVMGQNEDQVKATVSSVVGEGLQSVDVKFWPFWVTTVPNSQKAVHITVKFN